jgi:putative heme-binding domain-containing protein
MFDPLGDLWSADCHSSPVYQLLRGAYYPSFGKPHDGLGFGPDVCTHSHGSTAIAGMVYYAAEEFPPEYRGNTFVGNVMTCRINRDSLVEHGSTRITKEEPDFLRSDDPWFRPVDLRLGPDGAIYMADFYNRIIGHYEVPLDHPGRDRERGRVWRIVYKGTNSVAKLNELNGLNEFPGNGGKSANAKGAEALMKHEVVGPTPAFRENDFSKMGVKELVEELGSANIARRMLAMDELTDRMGEAAIRKMLLDKKANGFQRAHGLWVLQRLGKMEEPLLANAATDGDRLVRVHAMRILSETPDWTQKQDAMAMAGLKDVDPYVQRAAADAVGRHPAVGHVTALIALEGKLRAERLHELNKLNEQDSQLLHVVRMSLRNQLLPGKNFATVLEKPMGEAESRAIADVSLGVPTAESGRFLSKHIQRFAEPHNILSAYLRHVVRYAPDSEMGRLAELIRTKFADDLDFQLALFKSIEEGAGQKGTRLSQPITDWGAELAERLLVSVDVNTLDWRNSPMKGKNPTNPWFLEDRASSDGKSSQFISSLSPGGESLTGVLRSRPFTIPARLSFFLAGHDGSPDKPLGKRNFVRLRDADTQKVLAQTAPPRNDMAQPFSWDLTKHAGKKGFLEIVDGNAGHSYAWLAVGRFHPAVVPMPKVIPSQVDKRQLAAAELAANLRLAKLEPRLARLVADTDADLEARAAAAKALSGFAGDDPRSLHKDAKDPLALLGKILGNADEPVALRQKIAAAMGGLKSNEAREILLGALPIATTQLQTAIALGLASTRDGAESLLAAAEAGKAPARLLQESSVKDRVVGSKASDAAARIAKVTANLPTVSAERQKIIDGRIAAYNPGEASPERGAAVFKQNCAVCHQVDGQGAVIGPQLDGIGGRGAERIIEDVLDPNRNVDVAFRTTLLVMKDGDVQTGLFRREEGAMIVLAQGSGQEISVPKKDVQERRETMTSLMPDNFSDAIKEADFNDLLAFLLSKRAK